MLRELAKLFRDDDPLGRLADRFTEMLERARELTTQSGDIYFRDHLVSPEERTAVFEQDARVNKLERKIRKGVIAHLALQSDKENVPYCLLLMSLVKDVERIGDYAKNLAEANELDGTLPDDDIIAELREIRRTVEEAFGETRIAFNESDQDTASVLINQLRDVTRRCDRLVNRVASSDYTARLAVKSVLGIRYYKRVAAHLLNVLSSVVMPLHKIDYYDERRLTDSAPDAEPAPEPGS